MTKFTREYLIAVIREEAGLSGADLSDVICMTAGPGMTNARNRAWYRIHVETGAYPPAIAKMWGCNVTSVRAGIESQAHAWETLNARLVSRYGVDRAASIIAGRDPASNADRASWRALGRSAGAAA